MVIYQVYEGTGIRKGGAGRSCRFGEQGHLKAHGLFCTLILIAQLNVLS